MGELPSLFVAGVQLFCGFMSLYKRIAPYILSFLSSCIFVFYYNYKYIVALFNFTWVSLTLSLINHRNSM